MQLCTFTLSRNVEICTRNLVVFCLLFLSLLSLQLQLQLKVNRTCFPNYLEIAVQIWGMCMLHNLIVLRLGH